MGITDDFLCSANNLCGTGHFLCVTNVIRHTYLIRSTDVNASDNNGCTYGGLHPCIITDDFLCSANNLCGTGHFLCVTNILCDTYLIRSTDVNASDNNGCTYGGLHPCIITDDFLCSANNLCGTGHFLC